MSKKEFITILAITLIVVLVWVASDWIHTRSNSKDLPDVQKYLEPIDPSFDKQTLDQISNLSTPGPAPSGGPIASSQPLPTPTPLATASTKQSPRPSSSPLTSPKPSASNPSL